MRDGEANSVEVVSDTYPEHVFLDLTGRCNSRCTICVHTYEDLPFEDYPLMTDRVINEARRALFPRARSIAFSGSGESLLHPRCLELFEEACNFEFLPILLSNGMILGRRAQQVLVDSGAYLRISIDGASPEVFERIRVGSSFKKVLGNVEKTLEYHQRVRNERFCLRFETTMQKDNLHELADIVTLAASVGAEQVFFHHLYTDNIPLKTHSLDHFQDECDDMLLRCYERASELGIFLSTPELYTSESRVLEEINRLRSALPINRMDEHFCASNGPDVRYPCRVPFNEIFVRPTGEVFHCCLTPEDVSLGNLEEQAFEEVWFGKGYRELRATINSANPPRLCHPRVCKVRKVFLDANKIRSNGGRLVFTSYYPNLLRYRCEPLLDQAVRSGGTVNLPMRLHNTGDTIWVAHKEREGGMFGKVNLGVQLCDRSAAVVERDFWRTVLPEDVPPGASCLVLVTLPTTACSDGLHPRVDLVVEGITWFGDTGQKTVPIDPGWGH